MSQHWYCALTGAPRYKMQGKNGKERNVTLRDAKAAPGTLVPSVSTINGQLSKDGLNTWLQTEAIKAAAENPRGLQEKEKDYIARILDLSKKNHQNAVKHPKNTQPQTPLQQKRKTPNPNKIHTHPETKKTRDTEILTLL